MAATIEEYRYRIARFRESQGAEGSNSAGLQSIVAGIDAFVRAGVHALSDTHLAAEATLEWDESEDDPPREWVLQRVAAIRTLASSDHLTWEQRDVLAALLPSNPQWAPPGPPGHRAWVRR